LDKERIGQERIGQASQDHDSVEGAHWTRERIGQASHGAQERIGERIGGAHWTGKPWRSALDRQAKIMILSERCACPQLEKAVLPFGCC
jgi:hypothetical protein